MFFFKRKKISPIEDPNDYKVLDLIPDKMPTSCNGVQLDPTHTRNKYLDKGMYGFVSWKWVTPFVEWIGDRKVLEVMSGKGWLARALRDKDVSLIATDDYSWLDPLEQANTLTKIEALEPLESITAYGESIDILIMSWPSKDDEAFQVIKLLNEINPDAVIVYIGEQRGGRTADSNFFNHYEEIMNLGFDKAAQEFERWDCVDDHLMLGKYHPNTPLQDDSLFLDLY